MEEKLISVIVPIYNVENYLRECIDSIISQTYKNLEIILVDDGSTDKSGEICDEYNKKDSRIKVIHKENGGLSDARNAGLDIAKGEYIEFIDSDDYIKKNMIEALYMIMRNQEADIVTCSHYLYCNDEVVKTKEYSKDIKCYNHDEAIKNLILDNDLRFYAWDKLYKKYLWETERFPVNRVYEDIATTPKIFMNAQKVVYYDEPLYYYRKRDGSYMNKRTKKNQIDYIKSINEINNYFKGKIQGIDSYLNYNIVHATINIFRSIDKYNLQDLKQENTVKILYEKTQTIMNECKNTELIYEKFSNSKKVHLYYLLADLENYMKNIKYLPDIYIIK